MTDSIKEALRALIQAESGTTLSPQQVEEAVESALQLRGYGAALSGLRLDNGEMPFNATFPPPDGDGDDA